MRRSFLLLLASLAVIVLSSCGESENAVDEDASADNEISDESNDESTDESTDEPAVTCADEWEKAEIIEDPEKFYDFKISSVKKSWKWDQKNDVETILIMSGKSSNPSFMKIIEDGTIILIGDLNGETCVECFNEFMHIYKPDGTLTAYGITGLYGVRAGRASFDEKTGEIIILFNLGISVQDGDINMVQEKSFIASFKDSSFKFKAWQTDTENMDMCDNFLVSDGNFHLLCMSYYSEDGTSYDRFKTRIISGIDGDVYYKTSSKDSGPIGGDVFQNTLYVSIADMDNVTPNYLQKYSTNTLCMEEQIDNIWNDKPVGFSNFKLTENRFYGFTMVECDGPDEGTENDLGIVTVSGYGAGIYVEDPIEGNYLISAGILSRVDNKGHRTFIRDQQRILESDGSLYAATSATGDYDGDGSPTDEELAVIWETKYETSYSSYITAVDKDLTAYVKEIKNGLPNSMAFQIAGFENYIYVSGISSQIFDPESIEKNIYISRIKKDSVIKEENKASEKSVRIEKFE